MSRSDSVTGTEGAPPSAYTDGEFLVVRREAVAALGSWQAAGVWHRVCWRAQQCGGSWVATIAEVAEECMLTEYAARGALDTIRVAGWLRSERAGGKDRTLRWVPVWAADLAVDSTATSLQDVELLPPLSVSPASVDSDGLFPAVAPAALASVTDLIEEEFAGFWRAYPRKVGKPAALRAYRTARKTVPMEAIAAGLRTQLGGMAARDVAYVPHPSTWLNQRRWEDAPEASAAPSPVARGRANYFAQAELAGRGAELLDSLGQQRPALGGGR